MPLNWRQYLPFNGPQPQGHETIPVSVPDGYGRRWVEVPAADFATNYAGGAGGGAVKAIRKTFALSDLAAYIPLSFPITGGNGGTATVIIAGDHRDVFPVGGQGGISGSVSADGYVFNVASSTFDGTHTTIVFGQTFGNISGGTLHNYGQVAGSEIYTPSSPGNEFVLSAIIEVTTGIVASASNVGVHLGVYSVADRFLQVGLPSDGSGADAVLGISDAIELATTTQAMSFLNRAESTPPTLLHTDGITLTIDDDFSGDDPIMSAGAIAVTVVLLTVTDA